MPTEIDSLQIEINAKAVKANEAIDRLVGKLNILSTSLSKINGSSLTGLANGVQKLGTAMQTMNTIKTADFTRLAKNLIKLTTINVAGLNGMASSLSHVTRAFNSLGTVSDNAQRVGELAGNLARFGYKSVTTATANIPQLATALSQLMATLSTAPRVSSNVIEMTNALAGLASQGRSMSSSTNAITSGFNRTTTAVTRTAKSTQGLASAFGKFYANFFWVIRGMKQLWNSIESTSDYIEAFNYYNVAFGKIASEWNQDWEKYGYANAEAYAESFTDRMNETLGKLSGVQIHTETGLLSDTGLKNLGLNIQEITQYASQLASVTNSLGQTGETTLAISQSFTKLAGDISSLFNVDYSTVATNLQSGLIGQSRALYKYGIDITNATLQTYAYELGLEKAVSEMTQMEKQQLRVLAILDQSKVSWGDLANTINSPSNMIRQLTNNLKEVGIVLGQLFIPLLQKVLPVINGVTIAIKRLLTNIAGLMGIELDLSAFGQGYDDSLEDMTEDMEELTDSAKKASGALGKFDEINNISVGTTTVDTSSGDSAIDLTQEIINATKEYESVWESAFSDMTSAAQEWADKFTPAFDTALDVLDKIAPALQGIAVAFGTYKIITLFSNFGSALSFLGSPAGIIALTVGAIAGLGFAIQDLWEDAKLEDVSSRFGAIALSLEDIEEVARHIIGNKDLERFNELLSEIDALDSLESSITQDISDIDKLNWKISIGMELTESDVSDYKATISQYVANVNKYITDKHYAATISMKLFFDESSDTYSDVQTTIDTFYGKIQGKMIELGNKLNDTVTEAFNDGILTVDEADAIVRIQRQMTAIQAQLASSQFEAELQLIEADFTGAELTYENYKSLMERTAELYEDYKTDLDESYKYALAEINVTYQAKFDAARTKEDEDKTIAEWEQAISELQLQRSIDLSDIELRIQSFSLNTLGDTYGDELDAYSKQVIKSTEDFLSSTTEGINLSALNAFELEINKVVGKMPAAVRANISEMIGEMTSSKELENAIDQYYKAGLEVPQSLINALSSAYMLEAINGSAESIWKLLALSLDGEERAEVLELMEGSGANIPDVMKDGIISELPELENGITDLFDEISKAAITEGFDLSSLFFSMGKNVAQSYIDGLNSLIDDMKRATAGYAAYTSEGFINKIKDDLPEVQSMLSVFSTIGVKNPVEEALGIHSPSRVFKEYGENVVEGFKIGFLQDADSVYSSVGSWAENIKPNYSAPSLDLGIDGFSYNGNYGNNSVNNNMADVVYRAVYDATLSAGQQNKSEANVNVYLEGEAKGLFKVVRKEADEYFNRTGSPAFIS